MSRRILVLAVLAAALLTVQTTAWAKGASKGTVSGGGLASPISVTGEGEPGSGDLLARLAEQTGAYVAMYGEDAGSGTLVAARPTGSLGPHFLVTYSVPSPAGGEDAVRQDLYPFAAQGPVSFTAGGQRFMDGMQTGEGWFQAPVALRETLAAIGVRKASNAAAAQPAEAKAVTPAAASQPARSGSAAPLLTAGAVVALLLAGGLTTVALRRRSSSS